MIATMSTRDRLRSLLAFQPVDRLPIVEWATWWDKTIARWEGEGLPPGLDRYDLYWHFGLDDWRQAWIGTESPGTPRPAGHGAGIIEDADGYVAVRPFLYPERLTVRGTPLGEQLRSWRELHERGDIAIWFTVSGFFWFPRTLLGIERHLYAFYDNVELMHRINDDLATWMLTVIDRICEIVTPDFMTFAEDMSYNNGPMLSEAHFDEFMLPYYQRVVPALRERGIVPIVDSDGDITVAAPWFERAGISGILPLERQAGVDMAVLREHHPRMNFIGAFDKMCMTQGEVALRAEFERLLPVARQGGFAISVDHQTPPGVSLADYELFIRLFKEYAVM